ncbi:MAG: redoxin domain-containing protein [Gammaproteobacteria bacterium]|nr:redoxin domain-containing protein [Gammaproteobacteria bacterium]
MFSARLIMPAVLLVTSFSLAGCSGISDDLAPSGDDKRPAVEAGTIGTRVGQQSPDFSMLDTLGNSRGLYAELAIPKDAVVLYFIMWCPVCDEHADDMRNNVIPNFPDVRFFLVDYVSGSVLASRDEQLSNGYADITTLVDFNQAVFKMYQASMGTTVVIDGTGIVRMNEDYKDGVKLTETLQVLP